MLLQFLIIATSDILAACLSKDLIEVFIIDLSSADLMKPNQKIIHDSFAQNWVVSVVGMLINEVAHPLSQSQSNSWDSIMKEFLYSGDELLHAFTDLCTGLYFCFNFEEKALEITFSKENLPDS